MTAHVRLDPGRSSINPARLSALYSASERSPAGLSRLQRRLSRGVAVASCETVTPKASRSAPSWIPTLLHSTVMDPYPEVFACADQILTDQTDQNSTATGLQATPTNPPAFAGAYPTLPPAYDAVFDILIHRSGDVSPGHVCDSFTAASAAIFALSLSALMLRFTFWRSMASAFAASASLTVANSSLSLLTSNVVGPRRTRRLSPHLVRPRGCSSSSPCTCAPHIRQ